ncbi:protein ANTAGONIST OF LIKE HETEROCHROMATIN PROTEIN 1-like [Camellia sinensis]|uniref:protein ANTAGONIST OF LIKE HETEROCHROMATIN PROTEIN 1-like n=1 Tax=Camellia sinensis TaxID=4442 RepID=UPI001036BAFB|nr:protein ANTAGONIST OF LIKE HETEROCHROMATIN PROTEIN 1-like [Camellia sinensis]
MDSRALSALLSTLISELLITLLLLFPSITNFNSNSNSNSSSYGNLFPLIHHFLSTSEIAASLSLFSISRKRKRTHHPDPAVVGPADGGDDPGPELGQLGRVDSAPDSSPLNLSAETRLGIGLFRLSTGADYSELARRFKVSEPVSKFCVKQLCRVLCTNFRFWVGFPSSNELESVSNEFESLTGMPNCCGVIDCARFKIVRDNGFDKQSSNDQNRKDSIAAQIVVDSSSRILSIVAGFPGNKPNSLVLKSSTLYKDIEGGNLLDSPPIPVNGVDVNQYLVGDREYPLLPWLIVPFVDPVPGSCEASFNEAHHLMRLSALRTVASLKNWGVLNKPIEAEFKTAVAYIGACSILHNALLMREDYSALCDGLVDYSRHEQSSQYYRDVSVVENSIEKKALIIRSALATSANGIQKSDQAMDPGSSEQLQN